MSTAAAAQLMSVTLYYKRFFPYYAFCMIAGLDENGKLRKKFRILWRPKTKIFFHELSECLSDVPR